MPLHRFTANLKFLFEFLRKPQEVASVWPSSSALEHQLACAVAEMHPRSVVELGPGLGGTTAGILGQLGPSGRLLCIETNAHFVERLRALRDPRLEVCRGDALQLKQILKQHRWNETDLVVSGVPFSALPPIARELLVAQIAAVLRPGGTFIAYQLRDHITSVGDRWFGAGESKLILKNFPPLRIHYWRRPTTEGGSWSNTPANHRRHSEFSAPVAAQPLSDR